MFTTPGHRNTALTLALAGVLSTQAACSSDPPSFANSATDASTPISSSARRGPDDELGGGASTSSNPSSNGDDIGAAAAPTPDLAQGSNSPVASALQGSDEQDGPTAEAMPGSDSVTNATPGGTDDQPAPGTPIGAPSEGEALAPDAAAESRPALGEACSFDAQCASEFCVDGVCCNEACTGVCAACDVTGSEGTCSTPQNDAACGELRCPDSTECRIVEPLENSTCRALGECRSQAECVETLLDVGQRCQHDAGTCNGEGSCLVLDKKPLGDACQTDDECAENHCVIRDGGRGICCSTACDGACQSCNDNGLCNRAPADDARCEVLTCPNDSACQTYPDPLTQNRCASFGQCVRPEAHCIPELADAATPCGSGLQCQAQGTCESVCSASLLWCDSECIDPSTDRKHCGASGSCSASNQGASCSTDELCTSGSCRGFRDVQAMDASEVFEAPLLTATGNDSIVAAWREGPTQSTVATALYNARTNRWSSSRPIFTTTSGVYDLSLAGGVEGEAGAIWWTWHEDLQATVAMASTLDENEQWVSPTTVSRGVTGEQVKTPLIAMTSARSAVAIWENSSSVDRVYFNHLDGGEWQLATPLADDSVNWSRPEALDGAPDGTAMAVWASYASDEYRLIARHFDAEDWGATTIIQGSPSGFNYVNAKSDHLGNYYVAWASGGSSGSGIGVRKYVAASSSWEDVRLLNTHGAFLTLVVAADGTPHLAWWGDQETLWSRASGSTGAWSAPKRVGTGDAGIIGTDGDGNVVALWQGDPDPGLMWAYLPAGSDSWSPQVPAVGGHVSGFRAVFDNQGRAVATLYHAEEAGTAYRPVFTYFE